MSSTTITVFAITRLMLPAEARPTRQTRWNPGPVDELVCHMWKPGLVCGQPARRCGPSEKNLVARRAGVARTAFAAQDAAGVDEATSVLI